MHKPLGNPVKRPPQRYFTTAIRQKDNSNLRYLATETGHVPLSCPAPGDQAAEIRVGLKESSLQAGTVDAKYMVSIETEYKTAAGRPEGGGKKGILACIKT